MLTPQKLGSIHRRGTSIGRWHRTRSCSSNRSGRTATAVSRRNETTRAGITGSSSRSGIVVDELRKRGFKPSAILDEGILEWHRRGYPVVAAPGVTAPPKEPVLAPGTIR